MSKKPLKRPSSKKRSGNPTQEQKRELKPVDPEYEEWLDDLDKERHSNQYLYLDRIKDRRKGIERRKTKRYRVNLKGVIYGNKECEGSHSV